MSTATDLRGATAEAEQPLALEVAAWARGIGSGWANPSRWTVVATACMAGVLGDAVTTSMFSLGPGLHEANPLMAAGQAAVGSVPVFMALLSVPLLAVLLLVAAPAPGWATRTLRLSLVCLGAVKLGVAAWNTGMLIGVGVELPAILAG